MKWIRRKPSVRVHGWTMFLCSAYLAGALLWLRTPLGDHISFVMYSARVWYVGDDEYRGIWPAQRCYVIERDGRIQVLGDGSRPSDKLLRQTAPPLFRLDLTSEKSGFFAPTTMRIEHKIVEPMHRDRSYPDEFWAFSDRWRLGILLDEDGFISIDPILKQTDRFTAHRILWSGHVINTLVLVAFIGSLWSLRWIPRQVRHVVRQKRYLSGLCPFCCYDLSGTPDRCPECGWGHEDDADEG